nr:PD-(D/E)XK nuclease family protein [Streptomyces sp. 769]
MRGTPSTGGSIRLRNRSYSQYSQYGRCGHEYELERVKRVPVPPAAWFMQGTAVHAAIEAFEKSGRTMSKVEAVDAYVDAWSHEQEAMFRKEPDLEKWRCLGRKRPPKDLEDRYREGHRQVVGYIDYVKDSGETIWTLPDGQPAIEVRFEIKLNGVPVIGFIDQIIEHPDLGLMVRDIKTGTKLPGNHIQLVLYKLAIKQLYGVDIAYGDYWMGKNLAPTDPQWLDNVDPAWLAEQFRQMDIAERNKVYLANPGDHCRICGVKKWCKIFSSESQNLT